MVNDLPSERAIRRSRANNSTRPSQPDGSSSTLIPVSQWPHSCQACRQKHVGSCVLGDGQWRGGPCNVDPVCTRQGACSQVQPDGQGDSNRPHAAAFRGTFNLRYGSAGRGARTCEMYVRSSIWIPCLLKGHYWNRGKRVSKFFLSAIHESPNAIP